jgi:hypothetical protein
MLSSYRLLNMVSHQQNTGSVAGAQACVTPYTDLQ